MNLQNNKIAKNFYNDYEIEYYDEGGYQGIDEKEVSKMLIDFAKMHAVNILKSVCKTELEYQRSINLLENIK